MGADVLKVSAARTDVRMVIVAVSVLVFSVAYAWSAGPAEARPNWRNDGCRSTVVRNDSGQIAYIKHVGYATDDTCFGSKFQDVFWTKGGNDYVRSYEGNDKIHLGGGHDRAFAGDGHDTIWTGAGEDIAYGGDGRDFFWEKTFRGGSDWDCYIAGPGRDDAYIQDGDDIVMDDYWGGKGQNDRYPQIDSFCDSGGSCVQDNIYQVEDGPCAHDPNADCTSPGPPKDVCQNRASKL